MIFATDAKHAEMFAKTVFDAVQPDKPTLLPEYVWWKEAPKDQQPAGAVLPGIQRFWGLQGT